MTITSEKLANFIIGFKKPVLIETVNCEYPIITNKNQLGNRICKAKCRFPIDKEVDQYGYMLTNVESYKIKYELAYNMACVCNAEKYTMADMLYSLYHVPMSTFVLNLTKTNILYIYEELSRLKNKYAFFGRTKALVENELEDEAYKIIISFNRLSSVFFTFDKELEGLAVGIEIVATEDIENGTTESYVVLAEYIVYANEREPVFYLDGERLIEEELSFHSYILDNILDFLKYTQKKDAIHIEQQKEEKSYKSYKIKINNHTTTNAYITDTSNTSNTDVVYAPKFKHIQTF